MFELIMIEEICMCIGQTATLHHIANKFLTFIDINAVFENLNEPCIVPRFKKSRGELCLVPT